MRGAWRIARVAGVDLSLHWTLGLLLAWVLISSLVGRGVVAALTELTFVVTLFTCVVLHELGHALAARAFGVPTHGITLLPIGGVAHLDRIPRDPWQEWIIALAGPAVNVMIVGLLFPFSALLHGSNDWGSPLAAGQHLLVRLMWINVMLVAFNLIPAFPMDGGRLLRSWFATRTDYLTATRRAKRLGQIVAVLLALWGLWANLIVLIIAAFVFLAAETEYRTVLRDAARAPGTRSPVGHLELLRARVLDRGEDGRPAVAIAHGAAEDASSVRPGRYCHEISRDGVITLRACPTDLVPDASTVNVPEYRPE